MTCRSMEPPGVMFSSMQKPGQREASKGAAAYALKNLAGVSTMIDGLKVLT